MKKKLLASIMATTVITTTIPISAMALTTEGQENNTTVVEQAENGANIELKANTTTPSAVEVKPIVTVDFNNECDCVNEALKNFKASNDTTAQEILNEVKNSVDSTTNIEFGTNEGQALNIIKATTTETGTITGTLIVKDALGDSKEILVNLTIAQLEVDITIPVIQSKNEVAKLEVSLDGNSDDNVDIGQKLSVSVQGYNANSEKVELDSNKLFYVWFANDEVVGKNKELEITENLKGKSIHCKVDYQTDEQGAVK